jgi:dipeptidyl aminopeptidase/acylaminoacyl peptidase
MLGAGSKLGPYDIQASIGAGGMGEVYSARDARLDRANYSIFMRETDGSPAIRLGDGNIAALSPDGRWVLDAVGSPAKLVLLPTGVGEPRQLTDNKAEHFGGAWLPDGKSIVFSANEPGRPPRTYLLDLQGGAPRALTPEGIAGSLITPDGKFLLATDNKRQRWLYPIAGGEPQKLNLTLSPDERILSFFVDGKTLLLRTRSIPVQITRVDLATGHREPWKQIVPADLAGVHSISTIKFSADGKSYAYSTFRVLSDLYVVDGLR